MNLNLQQSVFNWKPSGHIYMWQVLVGPRSYKGSWNFNSDTAGRASLLSLLRLMCEADENTKKTIRLDSPDGNIVFPVLLDGVRTWDRLVIVKSIANEICLREQEGKLLLSIGGDELRRLISELENVSSQNERFIRNICGDKNQELAIWW